MNSLPAMKSSVPRLNKFPASCTGNLPQALEAAAPIRTRIARLAHDPQKFAAIFPARMDSRIKLDMIRILGTSH